MSRRQWGHGFWTGYKVGVEQARAKNTKKKGWCYLRLPRLDHIDHVWHWPFRHCWLRSLVTLRIEKYSTYEIYGGDFVEHEGLSVFIFGFYCCFVWNREK